MSTRNVRKLFGGNSLPPPEGNSDEEFQPLYAKSSSSSFKYQGLVMSSHSESEHESTDAIGIENACSDEISKKKKKKKKKQRKAKSLPKTFAKEELDGLDEIDKSVMEVNALLGSPPEAPPPSEAKAVDPEKKIFAVQLKYLDADNELNKLFGPEPAEEGARRKKRMPELIRLQKKITLVPVRESILTHTKCGLSMTIQREENGFTYFVFAHSREYQRIHKDFISKEGEEDSGPDVEEARRNMHVEALLEVVASMFQYEAYSAAFSTLELIIAYMQYVSHPTFRVNNMKVRLEYQFIENRAFHIAVFQYMYMLSNRACHRTALEMAKMLLNLDPSDPLAVLLVIDTLALRAREHQWLIEALDYFKLNRDADFLLNLQYSYAMAHFHVAKKAKSDLSHADSLLKAALVRYPGVIVKIFECANVTPNQKMADFFLFETADKTAGKAVKEMTKLYAHLCWSKWREPAVLEWAQRVTAELADEFATSEELQRQVIVQFSMCCNLFRRFPREVRRHLSIIKPMTELLFDAQVSFPVNKTPAYDPVAPADGASRYGYDVQPPVLWILSRNSPFYDLVASVYPNYPQQALERQFNNVLLDEIGRAAEEMPPVAQAAAAAPDSPPPAGAAPVSVPLYIQAVTKAFLRFMRIDSGDTDNPLIDADQLPVEIAQALNIENIPIPNIFNRENPPNLDTQNQAQSNTDQAHSSGSQPNNSTDSNTDQPT